MCGICGVYNLSGQPVDPTLVFRMTAILRHRGPDDQGLYVDGPIALGMARLAIVDLSPAAYQPMSNEDGSVWIIYNGETYNHRELRKELEVKCHHYRSNSDSESVLHAYEEYGEGCLQHLRGMYAFAIWDAPQRKLFLAVDRLGIKPLYYCQISDVFLFASELKAILQHPAVRREIDFLSLDEYLRYCYIPAPRTIFKGIQRLSPGHFLTVQDGQAKIRQYWDLRFMPNQHRSEKEWIEETHELLRQCVQDELESDVPLGALFSGGIDSSAIVAFMSQASPRPVQTFTIGFNTPRQNYGHYDETAYARIVAQRFGCDHHEFRVEPKVLDMLPKMIWHFDEPFANVTAIPTWYLCQVARQYVTVALAGAGGDEDFGGYPRYLAARFLPAYFALPSVLRDGLLKRLAHTIPQQADGYSILNRAKRFFLGADTSPEPTYRNWVSFWPQGSLPTLYTLQVRQEISLQQTPTIVDALLAEASDEDLLNRIFYADLKTYLPDNLLTYSDRMASAHSLEMRVPFCDYRLVEFAATIPSGLKLKGFTLKYLLKKALDGLLPRQTLYRRKQGFSVPLGYWLKSELLPLAKAMLSTQKIEQRGYFNVSVVQGMLGDHLAGKADHSARLWALIIFELWHTLYLDQNILDEPSLSLNEESLLA